MSRNRMVLTYTLGVLFGALAFSKPFLSDRWILVTIIGGCLCSLMWAAFEKLDQLKRGKPKREEPIEPAAIDKTCPTCHGARTIGLIRHGKMTHIPCYTCKGSGWQKLNPPNAA